MLRRRVMWPDPGCCSTLGIALQTQYKRIGRPEDLERAVALLGEAIGSPVGQADRTSQLAGLGTALQSRFERTGRQEDLDQAIALIGKQWMPPPLATLNGLGACST